MKISNRKDSAREDASEDGPDDAVLSSEVKNPTSSQQEVPSAAKEAPKSPEPMAPVVNPTTSQVPSATPAAASKPAKSHSSQSVSLPSSYVHFYNYSFLKSLYYLSDPPLIDSGIFVPYLFYEYSLVSQKQSTIFI